MWFHKFTSALAQELTARDVAVQSLFLDLMLGF